MRLANVKEKRSLHLSIKMLFLFMYDGFKIISWQKDEGLVTQ